MLQNVSYMARNNQALVKRFGYLMSGTVIAQIIPIAASPLLTRLFTPAEMGTLTLYVSIVMLLSVAGAGRFELALGLPKRRGQAVTLLHLAVCVTLLTGVGTALVIGLAGSTIAGWLGGTDWHTYLYILPLSMVLFCLFQITNYWLNRCAAFKRMAGAKVIQTGTTALAGILAGLMGANAVGLIVATVLGYAMGTAAALAMCWREFKPALNGYSARRLGAAARKYGSFPLQSAPGGLANIAALQLPVMLIAFSYSDEAVGQFGLMMRVVAVPSVFLGYAAGQVYYHAITENIAHGRPVFELLSRGAKMLAVVALLPYGVLLFFGQPLFALIFGPEWAQAGLFASILAPGFFMRFIASSLSLALPALHRNDLAMRWQLFNLIAVCLVLGVAATSSLTAFIGAFCVLYTVSYATYLGMILLASRQADLAGSAGS